MNKIYKPTNNPAFSLVETMVALAILAIIVAVVVPIYQDNTRKASITKAISKLTAMQNSLTENYQLNGQWPATFNSTPAGTDVSDSSFPFISRFVYDNNGDNKAWYGYQLDSEYGNGWVVIVVLYNAGTFESHCGALTTGCTTGDYGSCNSIAYYPAGCDEINLSSLTT